MAYRVVAEVAFYSYYCCYYYEYCCCCCCYSYNYQPEKPRSPPEKTAPPIP